MWRIARWLALGLASAGLVAAACKTTTNPPADGGGAQGAGGCPTAMPWFTIHVTAAVGPVPADTRLLVSWSAGEEPPFDLGDPSTWRSVEEGANVDCDLPVGATPPVELDELTCELWTSGATDVELRAAGYVTVERTLTPAEREECEGPVPSDADLELVRDPDAGA